MKALFEPIQLGPVTIQNRVALAPMGLGIEAVDETWPERYYPFIEERCRGETGLIIAHFNNATPLATTSFVNIYEERTIGRHQRLADLVHRYGSKVFVQLAAFGGQGGDAAPSAIESPLYPQVPRELTLEEIERIITDFGQSARRARRAGYDGVELHGAHDYLVGAFMSPHTNRRDDAYGGDLERRMRFPVEIVRAIKREVGDDFPVGFKFSAWEEMEDGVDQALAVCIAERMVQEGVAYLHVSSSTTYTNVSSRRFSPVASMYTPRNTLLPLVQAVKARVKEVPILAGGSISDPAEAAEMLARGDCDMVVLGRALLADPHWARKARLGEGVVPCIRCNVCHYFLGQPNEMVVCSVNPHLGLEAQDPYPLAGQKKRVLVVGGGPGGIVAAYTAARRGHEVTLCEKAGVLGGAVIPGSRPEFKAEFRRLLHYWEAELRETGVSVRLNCEVTPLVVREMKPDALVIAVGARPILPRIPGIEGPHVMSAVDALLQPDRLAGQSVVMLGGGDVGCECALYLAQRGCRVTIVEQLPELMSKEAVHVDNRTELLRMLTKAGVEVWTSAKATTIDPQHVTIRIKAGEERVLAAEAVVVAIGLEAKKELAHALSAECGDVWFVGDCVEPAQVRLAVREGDLAGRLL